MLSLDIKIPLPKFDIEFQHTVVPKDRSAAYASTYANMTKPHDQCQTDLTDPFK